MPEFATVLRKRSEVWVEHRSIRCGAAVPATLAPTVTAMQQRRTREWEKRAMSSYTFSIRTEVHRNVMYIEQRGRPTAADFLDLKRAFLPELAKLQPGL